MKVLLAALLLSPILLFVFVAPVNKVHAQPLEELCSRYDPDDDDAPEVCREDSATRGETAQDNRIVSFLGEVISIMLYALGIISVIAVIVGGFFYITSGGDPQRTQRAKNTILYALIGVVVAVAAQLIILFVLDRLF